MEQLPINLILATALGFLAASLESRAKSPEIQAWAKSVQDGAVLRLESSDYPAADHPFNQTGHSGRQT